jgi:hypothetical protein
LPAPIAGQSVEQATHAPQIARRFDGHEIMTCATVSGSVTGQPTVILISVDRELT